MLGPCSWVGVLGDPWVTYSPCRVGYLPLGVHSHAFCASLVWIACICPLDPMGYPTQGVLGRSPGAPSLGVRGSNLPLPPLRVGPYGLSFPFPLPWGLLPYSPWVGLVLLPLDLPWLPTPTPSLVGFYTPLSWVGCTPRPLGFPLRCGSLTPLGWVVFPLGGLPTPRLCRVAGPQGDCLHSPPCDDTNRRRPFLSLPCVY